MGTYDTIRIQCPVCKHTTEFQTKARDERCNFDYFSLNDAPLEIIADLLNKKLACESCGRFFILDIEYRTRLHAITQEEYYVLGLPDSYKTCKNCYHQANAECLHNGDEIFDLLDTCMDWRDKTE